MEKTYNKDMKKLLLKDVRLYDKVFVKVILSEGIKSITINNTVFTKNTSLTVRRGQAIEWSCEVDSVHTVDGAKSGTVATGELSNYTVCPKTTRKEASDIVFWDRQEQRRIVVSPYKAWDYNNERYVPIGIMVVPIEHDIYGTGEGAMMSLRVMSPETPDEGSDNSKTSVFYGYATGPIIRNFKYISYLASYLDPNSGFKMFETNLSTLSICLPSDYYNQYICAQDKKCGYEKQPTNSANFPCPSPYLNNGRKNLAFFDEVKDGQFDALADIYGKEKTEMMWEAATAQSDWRTQSEPTTVQATPSLKIEIKDNVATIEGKKNDIAIFKCECGDCTNGNCQCGCDSCDNCKTIVYSLEKDGVNELEFTQDEDSETPMTISTLNETTLPPIEDKGTEGYYPAACCAWRYHTEGTEQGEWYLPALGEISYIARNFNSLIKAQTFIKNDLGLPLLLFNLSSGDSYQERICSISCYATSSVSTVSLYWLTFKSFIMSKNAASNYKMYMVRAFCRISQKDF